MHVSIQNDFRDLFSHNPLPPPPTSTKYSGGTEWPRMENLNIRSKWNFPKSKCLLHFWKVKNMYSRTQLMKFFLFFFGVYLWDPFFGQTDSFLPLSAIIWHSFFRKGKGKLDDQNIVSSLHFPTFPDEHICSKFFKKNKSFEFRLGSFITFGSKRGSDLNGCALRRPIMKT